MLKKWKQHRKRHKLCPFGVGSERAAGPNPACKRICWALFPRLKGRCLLCPCEAYSLKYVGGIAELVIKMAKEKGL